MMAVSLTSPRSMEMAAATKRMKISGSFSCSRKHSGSVLRRASFRTFCPRTAPGASRFWFIESSVLSVAGREREDVQEREAASESGM